jgi:tRNA pseudouridine55 synthase
MDGILLIDKPKGWTSFDVVAKVRGLIRAETGLKKPKVGHTGTLDPAATGLLVLVLGNYTKRAGEFSRLGKTYEVTVKLGETSTTGDEEGQKTAIPTEKPPLEAIQAVLKEFTGEIEQVPPAFSAIKIDGQRAYKLARAGKKVELEARRVTVHSLQLAEYSYPEIKFTAKVSSGTYIRSLVEDIGKKLGTGAYTSDLRRTEVGEFAVQNAMGVSNLNSGTVHSSVQRLA